MEEFHENINRNKYFLILFCLISFLSAIPLLWNDIEILNIVEWFRYLIAGFMTLFVLPIIFHKNPKRFNFFIITIIVFGIILSLISLYILKYGSISLFGIRHHNYLLIPGLGIYANGSIFDETNYFGVSEAIVSLLLIYMINQKGQKYLFLKIVSMLFLFTVYFSIFLSRSRSAILVSIVFIISYFFLVSKRFRYFFLVLLPISGIIIYFYLFDVIEKMIVLYKGSKGLTLHGRDVLWQIAAEAFCRKPIMGWGVGNLDLALIRHGADRGSSQSTYFAYLISGGIMGFFLYLSFLILIAIKAIRSYKEQLALPLIIIIGILIDGLFRTYNLGGSGFIPFMFTFACGTILYLSKNKNAIQR
jgi:O-antigen ligase